MKPSLRIPKPLLRAFSLVEVAIAMGIVSFCLVAMLGLLPVGLSTFREATEKTIESQIINQITSEAAAMPFSQLSEYAAGGPYYFDDEGTPVRTAPEGIFRAEISVRTPNYPGKPPSIESDLLNVQVKITTDRNRRTLKKIHNLFVARSDRNPDSP